MRRTPDGEAPRQGKHAMAHKKLNKAERKAAKQARRTARHTHADVCNPEMLAPDRKHWSPHDLMTLRGKNDRQNDALQGWFQGDHLALLGSAGTGKTLLAFYCAMRELTEGKADGVSVVRSAVQSRNQGFLPGTGEQKMEPYELPYRELMAELFPRLPNTYDDMKREGLIEFASTSFQRGRTLRNRIVIVEEGQNMDFDEIDTMVTRIGDNARLIVTGDTRRQNDLKRNHEVSGLPLMQELLQEIGGFTVVDFLPADVVRSGLAKAWILAVERRFARAA